MTSGVSPGNTQMTFGGSLRSSSCSERFGSLHPESANHFRIRASRSLFLVENDFKWASMASRVCKRTLICAEAQTAQAMQAISVWARGHSNGVARVLAWRRILARVARLSARRNSGAITTMDTKETSGVLFLPTASAATRRMPTPPAPRTAWRRCDRACLRGRAESCRNLLLRRRVLLATRPDRPIAPRC